MDCLQPGDIAIFATPPAFRWVHFAYAIEKGINVFMEKPTSVDGPTVAADAQAGRRIGEKEPQGRRRPDVSALQGPHGIVPPHLQDGEIGDIELIRAYRIGGPPTQTTFSERKPAEANELMWQIKRFHSFLWASGGICSDSMVHNVDEACWMKDAWPVKALGIGGRHYPRRQRRSELRQLLDRIHLRRRRQVLPRRRLHPRLRQRALHDGHRDRRGSRPSRSRAICRPTRAPTREWSWAIRKTRRSATTRT